MTNLAKIKWLYLWQPSICKTFWTTSYNRFNINTCHIIVCYNQHANIWLFFCYKCAS